MASSASLNFRSCCRLCLSEADSVTSMFQVNNETNDIVNKISALTNIMVTPEDKITTSICDKCSTLINNFESFKNTCVVNQNVLKKCLQSFEVSLMNDSICIKDEPIEDDVVFIPDDDVVVKAENENPLTVTFDEDANDLPPILSPIVPTAELLAHLNSIEPAVPTEEVMETEHNDDTRLEETSSLVDNNNQQDKLEFAAGLQLQSRMDTINIESMTSAELEYAKKMAIFYSIKMTKRCCCHNTLFNTEKSLMHHFKCRTHYILFPLFTCQHCFTSCNTNVQFGKHRSACTMRNGVVNEFENIYQVANKFERGINKHRSYQMFVCMLCERAYRIFELYCQHVEEHLTEYSQRTVCLCKRKFDNTNIYKQHLFSSCILKQGCDICVENFDTVHEFKRHCLEKHDKNDGLSYPVHEDFQIFDIPFEPQYACVECNMKCLKEQFLISHLKSSHTYDEENAIRVASDCFVGRTDSEDASLAVTSTAPESDALLPDLVMSVPTQNSLTSYECDICYKRLSTRSNLTKHQKAIHFNRNSSRRSASIRCGDCDQTFQNNDLLMQHLDTQHKLPCDECGCSFATTDQLYKHRSSHLKLSITLDPQTKKYKSSRSSNDMPNLLDDIDRKSLLVVCPFCKRLFATHRGCRVHQARMHPDDFESINTSVDTSRLSSTRLSSTRASNGTYKTNTNNKTRNNVAPPKLDLSKLNLSANNDLDNQYVCITCGQLFAEQQAMQAHIASTHGKVTSRNCVTCNMFFTNEDQYREHAKTHEEQDTIEPPAKKKATEPCKMCKMVFTDEDSLGEHFEEVHNLPYIKKGCLVCPYCGNSFLTLAAISSHLRMHRRKEHTWQRSYVSKNTPVQSGPQINCEICGCCFNSRSEMRSHLVEKHPF